LFNLVFTFDVIDGILIMSEVTLNPLEEDWDSRLQNKKMSHQRTVELTSLELDEIRSGMAGTWKAKTVTTGQDVKNESSTLSWAQHQSAAAISRLRREANKIEDDLQEKNERLKQVQAQIKHLENQGTDKESDGDSDDQYRWFHTNML